MKFTPEMIRAIACAYYHQEFHPIGHCYRCGDRIEGQGASDMCPPCDRQWFDSIAIQAKPLADAIQAAGPRDHD